jgi:hypothetical protein
MREDVDWYHKDSSARLLFDLTNGRMRAFSLHPMFVTAVVGLFVSMEQLISKDKRLNRQPPIYWKKQSCK